MAAKPVPGVLASFVHVDAAVEAIRALRARGYRDLTVYTAAPNHEIAEQRFFDPEHLPDSAIGAVRRRLAELAGRSARTERW